MVWNDEALLLMDSIEKLIIDKYKILAQDFSYISDNSILNTILLPRINQFELLNVYDLYAFYTLKIYNAVELHLRCNVYFDQAYAGYPNRGINSETNMFNSDNEIFNIANEFGLKTKDQNMIRQIFGRIRYLAKYNIFSLKVNYGFNLSSIDYSHDKYYETENFSKYFKSYIGNHKKHFRYLELLKKALVKSYYFRNNITIATSHKELLSILNDPLIYVLIEPFNYIV